jgi:predicted permease
VRIEPVRDAVVGGVQRSLVLLFTTVAFVLLIACVNVTNLFLARATARRGEIAVRTALGASRRRIVRSMLAESLVVSILGAAAGVLLAVWCQRLLVSLSPGNIPRLDEVRFDNASLGFVVLVTALVTLAVGLVPALRVARPDLTSALREEGRGGDGGGHRLRSALVVAEIALALILLTGAGLLVRSFQQMRSVDPGFAPDHVLTLTTIPRYELQGDAIHEFIRASLDRLSSIPGVESAAEINFLPFSGHDAESELTIAGRPPARPGEDLRFHFRAISPGYFQTMKVPVLRGRPFTAEDLQTPNVVIVNETAAQAFWPGGDPVGGQVRYGGREDWLTVVGVARDIRHSKLTEGPVPEVYVPYTADTYSTRTFVLRSRLDPEKLTQTVREEIRQVNKNLPLFEIQTLEGYLNDSLALERFMAFLLTLMAALASVLAVIGVYGLMAYSVARRTREIGIRMALGAHSADVTGMVLLQGARLVLVGLVLGLAGAAAVTRLLQGTLFGVTSTDPVTYLAGSAALAFVAFLASLVAVRRVSKIDPMLVLRAE